MESAAEDKVRFACGHAHDAMIGLLLGRALNVHAAIREQEDQAHLAQLHRSRIGPRQHAVKRRLAVQGTAQDQEMQRQKYGQRQAGQSMQGEGPPQGLIAVRADHSTTAATARAPRTIKDKPKQVAANRLDRAAKLTRRGEGISEYWTEWWGLPRSSWPPGFLLRAF